MHAAGPKNPLHGITLQVMVTQLVEHYGWEMLGRMIPINCFNWQPSIKSSLVFLRRTPWAREKVEALYIDSLPDMQPDAQPQVEGEGDAPPDPQDAAAPQDPQGDATLQDPQAAGAS